MTTTAMLKALADPMGVPFYPRVFQALGVLTFSLHILAVNLAVGAVAAAVYGRLQRGERWRKLSGPLSKTATAAVSAAILLGVAPLLFIQVLYDPFWYASNMLSAAWVIGFVFVMSAGYGLLYVLAENREGGGVWGGVAAVSAFLAAGAIMHALNLQMLAPEKWREWAAPGGVPAVHGLALHAFDPVRFAHFLIPAFAALGVFLMLYAWYYAPREDKDPEALRWAARRGAALAFGATAVETVAGFAWLLTLPAEFRFYANPAMLLAVAFGLALLAYFGRIAMSADPARHAPGAAGALLATVLAMAAARETLRGLYLGRFDYTLAAHTVHLDLGSTALFFGTFALGLIVAAWLLAVAFQAGRVSGRWEAGPRMRAWGRASIGILVTWLVVVVALGIVITLKNHGA